VKRILISIPEKFLAEMDKAAEQEQMQRSEFIRHLFREYKRKGKK
jgi:metal-responsive CopG/Arc/MetJ family transcriptional regulator